MVSNSTCQTLSYRLDGSAESGKSHVRLAFHTGRECNLTFIRAGRRAANNRIRGPQSALTDFLASNNISAAQISADYERRQREARQQEEQEAAANGEQLQPGVDEEERIETAAQNKKRKRQQEQTLTKIKASKDYKRQKKHKGNDPDGEGDDAAWDMYAKKKPLPGQLENCELCEKRFTVTAYSKTGPDGGLLCTKCSKEQEAQKKKDQKPKKQAVSRDKRRQVQSNLLDGIVQIGSKSLQELCIKVRLMARCLVSGILFRLT